MADDVVLDASAAAKLFFIDADSDAVQRALMDVASIFAPDLLFAEMASVAAKLVSRRQVSPEQGRHAVTSVTALLDDTTAMEDLAERAFSIATEFGFSAYDGCYLALAERRAARVLTMDRRMIRQAEQQGLGHLILGL